MYYYMGMIAQESRTDRLADLQPENPRYTDEGLSR